MLLSLLRDLLKGRLTEREHMLNKSLSTYEYPEAVNKRVLNVGGDNKSIPIPPQYNGWQHLLLDIDPRGQPDVLCDARSLTSLDPAQFDAVYCSHNLEHYFQHDVGKVLAGFLHVLKDDGFAHIRVPDMGELMRRVVSKGLDIEDFLYESSAGPIRVIDVIYGWSIEIERSGNDHFAHKTGFTQKSLVSHLNASGFAIVLSGSHDLEIFAIAFKNNITDYAKQLFNIPD
jgi:SAM-dependent methyltransferase